MEGNKIKITIKVTGGKNFEIEIDQSAQVDQLKELCESQSGIQKNEMRVIYKGRILKDQEILKEKNVQNLDAIHIVKGNPQSQQQTQQASQQNVAPTNLNSGAGNMAGLMSGINSFGVMSQVQNMMQDMPDLGSLGIETNPQQMQQMQQMLQNPALRQMMINMMSNPQTFDTILNMSPQLRQLVDSHPGMREMMTSPQVIEQVTSMINMMGRNQGGSGTMTGQPGTFPQPGQIQQQAQQANQQSTSQQPEQAQIPQQPLNFQIPLIQPQAPQVQQQINPSSQPPAPSMQQTQQSVQQSPQQAYLPQNTQQQNLFNPLAFNPAAFQQMQQMMQQFQNQQSGQQQPQGTQQQAFPQMPMFNPFFPSFPQAPVQQAVNPEVQYAVQLEKLQEMGFINRQVNIDVLKATGGNVEAAIERLFNMISK